MNHRKTTDQIQRFSTFVWSKNDINRSTLKNFIKISIRLFTSNFELIFWITALVYLFIIDPSQQHFTLCPLSNLGFDYCPGCGLGRSCAQALHGNFIQSLQMHPFGIFALLVISHRIFTLINDFKQHKNFNIKGYEYRT